MKTQVNWISTEWLYVDFFLFRSDNEYWYASISSSSLHFHYHHHQFQRKIRLFYSKYFTWKWIINKENHFSYRLTSFSHRTPSFPRYCQLTISPCVISLLWIITKNVFCFLKNFEFHHWKNDDKNSTKKIFSLLLFYLLLIKIFIGMKLKSLETIFSLNLFFLKQRSWSERKEMMLKLLLTVHHIRELRRNLRIDLAFD